MSQSHEGHDHAPKITTDNQRKVLIAFLITFTYMVVEVIGGLMSGSLALIADAGHMLTDAGALALSYAAFRFGQRAADQSRTYGYLRFEVIAGLVNAIALFAIVVWIAIEAIDRFRTPGEVLAGPMFVVAIVGLLINMLVFWILTRGDKEHVNIKGAVLHVMGDLLGSVGAISAAIIIYFTGWTPIDPILSIVVSILILRSAWALLRNSLHILLEGAPDNAKPEEIQTYLMGAVQGLAAVRHVHVWLITSGKALATLHVQPDADTDARRLVKAVEAELAKHFDIQHATIAIDWPDMPGDECAMGDNTHGHADHGHSDHDEAEGHADHDHNHTGHKH
ncbi:cation diffusion facilitator family transporter [Phyllobacterium myrsinacearum]|uniref:Cobalt-zinc-cadmium efflux system protein n=1 Tax=Phyllobacterium myrsinacearum TaxID=28101 RepID=A0A839EE92_9HYPH|nr:cation diffusion facilitator family transporter [Phyllobacterium myrsinacearum]MBA8877049.1 cobalt-zinc-cadmium efflux system protein [Phyllobacterium myrsinacearum]